MALGRELKDFLTAFTSIHELRNKRRHEDALEKYYEALKKHYENQDALARENQKGKDPTALDAYEAGRKRVGGSASSGGSGSVTVQAAYQSARDAGFSDNQARALVAEVGRENGLQNKFLYGSHSDPAKPELTN